MNHPTDLRLNPHAGAAAFDNHEEYVEALSTAASQVSRGGVDPALEARIKATMHEDQGHLRTQGG